MQTFGVMLGAGAVFLMVVAAFLPMLLGDTRKARLAFVDRCRAEFSRELEEQKKQASAARAAAEASREPGAAARWAETLKLARFFDIQRQKTRLHAAGWRGPNALPKLMLAQVGLPIVFGGYAALVVYGGSIGKMLPGIQSHLAVIGATVAGFGLPQLLVTNAIQKRQEALRKQFPDGLDLLLVCVEAGLSLDAALIRVTREIGDAIPELAEEFALSGAELAYLGDRLKALDNLATRTAIPEFKGFSTVVGQAFRFGTPVSRGLRQLVEESRQARLNAVEKAAGSLGPKMTIPMMLFILPTLFLIVLGPTVIRIMEME